MPGFRLKGSPHRLFVTGSVHVSGSVGAPVPAPAPVPTPTPSPPPPAPSINPWTQVTVNNSFNPFRDSGDGFGVGGAKHVFWSWHPVKKRVYTWGGDFGATGPSAFSFDGGNGTDAMPNGGTSFTTNAPSSPGTYSEAGGSGAGATSYRNDMYSIDPYNTGSVPWRLEHPYLPRNLSGVCENRPPCNCQQALVWDSNRSKFWGIATEIRGGADGNMYGGDVWAMGLLYAADHGQPPGTWSWTPSANGGAGTWIFESTAALVCQTGHATPAYTGNRLYQSEFAERLGMFQFSPSHDVGLCVSGRDPGNGGPCYVFIFRPGSVTYEYRQVFASGARGWSYICCATSPIAVVGDYAYVIGLGQNGSNHVSCLLRINLTNALALANGGSLADNTTNWQVWTLPWSLSAGGVWESAGNASQKWMEHCGVVAVDNKVVLFCSYDGVVDGGTTKVAIFSPTTLQFYSPDAAPENIYANSWVGLPDTAEIFVGLQGSPGTYPNGRLWRYRVSHIGPNPSAPTMTYNMAQESQVGHDGYINWQSVFLGVNGKIHAYGTGNHAPEQTNAVRILDPVTTPGSLLYSEAFPYTQSGGSDLYVSNYDNHPSIYLPSENKSVWIGHGVFDFAVNSWTFGDRSPNTQGWTSFLTPLSTGFGTNYYNPAVAFCTQLDKGYFFSASDGGGDTDRVLKVIERTSSNPPWRVRFVTIGAAPRIHLARNTACVVGSTLYVAGPIHPVDGGGNAFFTINLAAETFGQNLSAPTWGSDYFPQMVYDSFRNRLVLIGNLVRVYSLTTGGPWIDVTPSGWPGFEAVEGVYHPTMNAIYFRARNLQFSTLVLAPHFQWHRMVFTN